MEPSAQLFGFPKSTMICFGSTVPKPFSRTFEDLAGRVQRAGLCLLPSVDSVWCCYSTPP